LEQHEKDLEENIKNISEENSRLSKISYNIQEDIMKFVEKNRARDLFSSALVGALVSVAASFVLRKRKVRKKIYSWFFEDKDQAGADKSET